MELAFESFTKEFRITLKGTLTHTTGLGTDIFGNILRLDNLLGGMEERLIACREQLENVNVQLANAKQEVEKPFPQEDELKTKSARLDELNIMLNMDKRESEIVDGEPGEDAPAAGRDEPDGGQAAHLPPYIVHSIIAAGGRPAEGWRSAPQLCLSPCGFHNRRSPRSVRQCPVQTAALRVSSYHKEDRPP